MRIQGARLRLEADDHRNSTLVGLRLPSGATAGGLLFADDDDRRFLLFAAEELAVGDEVATSSERRYTVTGVRHAVLDREPVTVLQMRPRRADDPGDAVPANGR